MVLGLGLGQKKKKKMLKFRMRTNYIGLVVIALRYL